MLMEITVNDIITSLVFGIFIFLYRIYFFIVLRQDLDVISRFVIFTVFLPVSFLFAINMIVFCIISIFGSILRV